MGPGRDKPAARLRDKQAPRDKPALEGKRAPVARERAPAPRERERATRHERAPATRERERPVRKPGVQRRRIAREQRATPGGKCRPLQAGKAGKARRPVIGKPPQLPHRDSLKPVPSGEPLTLPAALPRLARRARAAPAAAALLPAEVGEEEAAGAVLVGEAVAAVEAEAAGAGAAVKQMNLKQSFL